MTKLVTDEMVAHGQAAIEIHARALPDGSSAQVMVRQYGSRVARDVLEAAVPACISEDVKAEIRRQAIQECLEAIRSVDREEFLTAGNSRTDGPWLKSLEQYGYEVEQAVEELLRPAAAPMAGR